MNTDKTDGFNRRLSALLTCSFVARRDDFHHAAFVLRCLGVVFGATMSLRQPGFPGVSPETPPLTPSAAAEDGLRPIGLAPLGITQSDNPVFIALYAFFAPWRLCERIRTPSGGLSPGRTQAGLDPVLFSFTQRRQDAKNANKNGLPSLSLHATATAVSESIDPAQPALPLGAR